MVTAPKAVMIIAAATTVVVLSFLFLQHRAEAGAEDDREAAVIAPSRMQEVAGEAVVVLDREAADRIGLRLAALRDTAAGAEERLAAEVVAEPERVAVVRAPLAGRLSVPAGGRWPGYGDRVRRGAEVGQVSDARPLVLSRSGTVTRLGAHPGEMVEAGQVLLEVTDYSEPLIRITWGDGAPTPPPPAVTLIPADVARPIRGRLVGSAPEVDPVSRRPAYLYRAQRSWPGARPGAPLVAAVPKSGGTRSGVRVPEAAVVQWEALAWTYVQRRPGHFARVRVPTGQPVPGGWLVSQGLAGGDSVVVQGAQQLLSEEFRARVSVGEETGE